jgi:hypothetical protein
MLYTFIVLASISQNDGDTIVGRYDTTTVIGENNVVNDSTNAVLIGSFLEVTHGDDDVILIGTSLKNTIPGQVILGKHSANSDAKFVLGAGTNNVPTNIFEVFANGSIVTPAFSSDIFNSMTIRMNNLEARINQLVNAATTPCGCDIIQKSYSDNGCCRGVQESSAG